MEPVSPPDDATNQAGGTNDELAAFEDSIAQALFSFGQTLVMDDLQELGNEE